MTGIAWAHETGGPLHDVSVKPSRQPRPQDALAVMRDTFCRLLAWLWLRSVDLPGTEVRTSPPGSTAYWLPSDAAAGASAADTGRAFAMLLVAHTFVMVRC